MNKCKVIAIADQKGGVGKTTTAFNFGVGLARQGKSVLLIDADAQASLTVSLGYKQPDELPYTLSDVLQRVMEDELLNLSEGILHHPEGVDLMPANIELSGVEVRLVSAMSRESILKSYVDQMRNRYEYILIDTMPSLGMLTVNSLTAADSVIIPSQPHFLSAKGLGLLLRTIARVKNSSMT